MSPNDPRRWLLITREKGIAGTGTALLEVLEGQVCGDAEMV